MLTKTKNIYFKYKQILLYLLFGGLTTVLNFFVYIIASLGFNLSAWLSSAIAWVFAIIFAFFTNKVFVFKNDTSETNSKKSTTNQLTLFIAARLVSVVINIGIMFVFVDILQYNEFVFFTISQIIIIIFNYCASKLVVFKQK